MKKFFSYILTFVVLFVISAATTVFMSYAGSDGGINPMLGVGGQGANSSFFTGVIGAFEEEKRFSVDGTIEIEKDGKKIPVSLFVNADISDTNNLKIDGYINIKINDSYKTLEFAFYNNTVYISFNGANLKVTTATINTLIEEVTNLVSTEVDADTGGESAEEVEEEESDILTELMPTLMAALENIKETTLENGDIKVELVVEGLAKVEAITTADSKPKNVKLETVEFSGIKVKADINLNFNNELVIFNPELKTNAKEYFDLQTLYMVVKNTASLRNFNAAAYVTLNDGANEKTLAVELLANILDGNYSLNLLENSFGYIDNANVTYLNRNLYVNANKLNVLVNDKILEQVPSAVYGLVTKLMANADINLDSQKLMNVVSETLSSITEEQIIGLIKMFKGFSLTAEGLTLKIDGSVIDDTQGEIELNIGFDGNNLSYVELNGLNISGNIVDVKVEVEETAEKVAVEEKESYLDIYNLYKLNKDFLLTEAFTLDLNLGFANDNTNLAFDSDIKLDFVSNYYEIGGKLTGNANLDLFVVYENDTAYLNINNIKIKTTKKYVEDLIASLGLEDKLAQAGNNILDEVTEKLKTVDVDVNQIISLLGAVNNFELSSNGLIIEVDGSLIGLEEDVKLEIVLVDNIISSINVLGLEIDGNKIDLSVDVVSNKVEKSTFDKTAYLDIETFVNGLMSIVTSTKGSIYANASLTLDERQYIANLVFTGDLSKEYMNLALGLDGEFAITSEITYLNDRLYLGVEDVRVSASKNFLLGIVDMFASNSEIDISQIQKVLAENKTLKNAMNYINSFSIQSLDKIKNITITSSHIEIMLDKAIFGAEEDLVVRIELYQSNPKEFELIDLYLADNAKISLKAAYSKNVIEKEIKDEDYLNIDKFIDGISNIVNADSFHVFGQIDLKDILTEQLYSLELDATASKEGFANFDLNNSYYSFTASFFGKEDVKVTVVYDEKVAYVTLNNIKVKMSKEDAAKLIGELNVENQAKDIANEVISSVKAKLASVSIESLAYMMTALNDVKVSGNNIYLELDGAVLGLNSVLKISVSLVDGLVSGIDVAGINLDNKEINADIDFEINNAQKLAIDKNEYLDVVDVVNKIIALKNLREMTATAKLSAVVNGESYLADVYFSGSLDSEYANLVLALSGAQTLDLNVIYQDEMVYANIEDIFVSVGKDFVVGLISSLNISTESLDMAELTSQVNELAIVGNVKNFISGFSIDSLKLIKELVVNSNTIKIVLDKAILGSEQDITVTIEFENNNISRVVISEVDITEDISLALDITLEQNVVVKEAEAEKYLDVEKIIESTMALKDLREVAIGALINAQIGDDNYILNADFVGSLDQEYLKLVLALTGAANLDVDVRLVDGVVYVGVEDIWASVEMNTIQSLLEKMGTNVEGVSTDELMNELMALDIVNNFKKFIGDFSIDSLKLVKNITINSSVISLMLDKSVLGADQDLLVKIDINDNEVEKLTVNNVKVNDEINVSLEITLSKQIAIETVNKDKYLNVENFISGLESYLDSNLVQLMGNVSLLSKNGEDFTEEMSLSLDIMKRKVLNDFMGYLNLDFSYDGSDINLETHYLKDTLFASIGGIKVGIEKDKIKESVHTILSMLGMEETAYDDIVDKIVAVLNGQNILDVLEIESTGEISIDGSSLDVEQIIKAVLSGVKISASGIEVNVDGSVFGYDSQINVLISVAEGKVSQITVNKLKIGDEYLDISVSLAQEDKLLPEFTEEQEATYMSVSQAVNMVDKVYDTIKNGTVSGDINLEIELFGEVNVIKIIYGIKYVDGKLSAYIQTNFKGLDVNVYLIDGVFYLDVVGMKIKVAYSEFNDIVDWLNQEFNLGIDIDFDNIEEMLTSVTSELSFDMAQISDLLNNTDFSFLEDIIFTNTSLEGTIGGTTIFVVYDELVKQVTFRKGTMFAELNCTSYDDFTLAKVNKDEYNSYTVLTDAYSSVINTVNEKQYSLDASAKVIANEQLIHDIKIKLDLDILNTIKMYADVVVEGEMPTLVTAAYQNEILYANYENLKLSIHQYNLREILVVVLEALGVDAKAIGFLGDVAENMDVSSENLNELIPALDFGNPLNMLKLIKGINIKDKTFSLLLDGKAILGDENANDMTVNVKMTNEGISSVELLNIYTGQENGELFNLVIDFKEFDGVPDVKDPETYIDISDSSGLIKAFVNTSNLNDYTITGNIKVVADIIGINIDMDIPVVVKVKITEDDVIVYANLDVPVIGSNVPGFTGINVNNDVPYEFGDTSIESRKLELMIKDGFVYIYRYDVVKQTVFANRIYEKQMKVSTEEFSWGLMDYLLSYGLGFSDTIMAEIEKAFDKATHREDNPLDISNVLLGYSKQENADVHQIVINLCELANNEMMDKAAIDIHLINNEQTQNKDYIGKLVFDIGMPLADGVNMNLKTDDLSLVDIGSALDMSYVNNFVAKYGYKENQQYERVDGGSWEFVGEKQYTIAFVDSMGNTPSSITATVDSPITLPTLSTIVQDKEDGRYTYTFAGWYTTETFKTGTEFNSTVMPRGDRTLYAKWNVSVTPKVTLSFDSMGGENVNDIYQLVGSTVVLPTPANKIVVDGQIKITYGFTGWFTDQTCQTKFTSAYMPNEDTTLYAGWEEIDRYVAYNLKVIDNGAVVYDEYVGEGSNIELSGFNIDSYTQYYLDSNFATRYTVSTMPSNDLTLYVRNRYALNIVSIYGNVYDTTEYHYQGDSYSLPAQNTYTTDDGNTRVTYTFNGYDGRTEVMPNSNLRVVANWTITTKYYYTVTFELAYNANAAYHKYATLYKNGVELGTNSIDVRVLEGTLYFSEYTADWKYTTGSWIFEVDWWYDFYGFSTSKNGSTVSSINVTGNTTVYGVWSDLHSN